MDQEYTNGCYYIYYYIKLLWNELLPVLVVPCGPGFYQALLTADNSEFFVAFAGPDSEDGRLLDLMTNGNQITDSTTGQI